MPPCCNSPTFFFFHSPPPPPQVARLVPGRTDVKCREAYCNVVKPGLSDAVNRPWTEVGRG